MGVNHPAFFYYPDPRGTLEVIDFGEGASDLQEVPGAVVNDAQGGDGSFYRQYLTPTYAVRIVLERFGPAAQNALERDLQSLQEHLHRGGRVGFCRNRSKAFASLTNLSYDRGDAQMLTAGNALAAWSDTADASALAVGDEVVFEQPPPVTQREVCALLSTSGNAFSLQSGSVLRYTYDQPMIARYRDCWVELFMTKEQIKPIVNHDHRKNFTLDVTLSYSVADAYRLLSGAEPTRQGSDRRFSTVPDLRGTTLQSETYSPAELLARFRRLR
ncbi:MAG: hypothetical protein AAFR76_01470 [Planctomycetota bacterium]